jgi:HEPN domain-containing protein
VILPGLNKQKPKEKGCVVTNQSTDESAIPLLNYGRKYHQAAEIVFDKAGNDPSLTPVLNFLYFHTVELLLKSYLQAHGKEPWGHKISELYTEASQFGLRISDDPLGLQNIASLLESGNEEMGFRYFSLKSGSEPELSWTRRVVGELLQIVAPFVESTCHKEPSRLAKLVIKFSEPVPRTV